MSLHEQRGDRWVREAERLHHRYLTEVVEAYGLCPWAEGARRGGRTRLKVVLEPIASATRLALAALDAWAAEADVEVGFIVFPNLSLLRSPFDDFVARVRTTDAARHQTTAAPFALASFHPDGEPDLEDADRLVPFLRRTPDPCIQAVRMSTLERLRGTAPHGTQFIDVSFFDAPGLAASEPSLRERIAHTNLETVLREGVSGLIARIEDIQRDRAQTYAAFSQPEQRDADAR